MALVGVFPGEYKPGGALGKYFCSSKCPTVELVWCRRLPDHAGRCSAYAFSISVPATWEKPRDFD